MSARPRFSWRDLTPQLFVVVILPATLLLLLVSFGGLYLHQQAMRDLVGERDERAARAAASALAEQVNHRRSAIQVLATQVGGDASPDHLRKILATMDFLQPDFPRGLAFLAPDGRLLASSGANSVWNSLTGTPAGTPAPAFQAWLESGAAGSSFTFEDPAGGEVSLLAAMPVPGGSGYAAGAFSPQALIQQALSSVFTPGEGSAAFVLDSQRRTLYVLGQPSAGENLMTHPGVAEALKGESGASFSQVQGLEHVIAYSPVPPLGWALVIEEPWEKLASPELRITESAPLALIPVVILALVVLWFATQWIVQPLRKLESQAAQLGWGDFQAIEAPVGGVAEIRRLHAELVHLARKVRAAQEGLRGYIGAMTRGQEEERRRLARELHDDTLQALIALNQRVQLLELALQETLPVSRLAGQPQEVLEPAAPSLNRSELPEPADHAGDQDPLQALITAISEVQVLTEQTIRNLRRATGALRPVYLEDLGLSAALRMLCQEVDQDSHLAVTFEMEGIERRLSAEEELAVYRIAQEALNNVIHHAQASRATVRMEFSEKGFLLEVSDNGQGFSVPESPAEFAPSGHYGLLGIHERAELIGARLEIQSNPGTGTCVLLRLEPLSWSGGFESQSDSNPRA